MIKVLLYFVCFSLCQACLEFMSFVCNVYCSNWSKLAVSGWDMEVIHFEVKRIGERIMQLSNRGPKSFHLWTREKMEIHHFFVRSKTVSDYKKFRKQSHKYLLISIIIWYWDTITNFWIWISEFLRKINSWLPIQWDLRLKNILLCIRVDLKKEKQTEVVLKYVSIYKNGSQYGGWVKHSLLAMANLEKTVPLSISWSYIQHFSFCQKKKKKNNNSKTKCISFRTLKNVVTTVLAHFGQLTVTTIIVWYYSFQRLT